MQNYTTSNMSVKLPIPPLPAILIISVLMIVGVLLPTASLAVSNSTLIVRVEPRVASVNGVIRVTLENTPPTLPVVVARLEGIGFASEYYTLAQGSTAVIDLKPFSLQPGVYYVAVYDSPGGVLLEKIPVLLVKARLLVSPPRPTVGEEFSVTPLVEPELRNVKYTIMIRVDSKVVTAENAKPIKLRLDAARPSKICLDLRIDFQGATYLARNVTCVEIRPNLPPVIRVNASLENKTPVLYVTVSDPDGIVVIANYSCTWPKGVVSGLLAPGVSRIPLPSLQGRNITISCTFNAIDDAGARTRKQVEINLSELYKSAPAHKTTKRMQRTTTTAPKTPTAKPTPRRQLPVLLLLLIPSLAAGAAAALFLLRRRRTKEAKTEKRETLEKQLSRDIGELVARMDRLEVQLGEIIGSVGELRGEIDEIKNRLSGFEEKIREIEEKLRILSRRGGR